MLQAINTQGYTKTKVWCGPSCLSALTGAALKSATEVLCRAMHCTSYQELEGVHDSHMAVSLLSFGYTMTSCEDFSNRYSDLKAGPSLKRYIAEQPTMIRATKVLLRTSDHYITAHMGWVCDNWTMKPVPAADYPREKLRIKNVFIIKERNN